MAKPLVLTRAQILAFRRAVSSLDERMPQSVASLRRAAWAGLQDSMPRAALLSIHARVAGARSDTWQHRSLTQVWGPRFNAYVVPERDAAIFTLGRLPDDAIGRRLAEDLIARLDDRLAGQRLPHTEAVWPLALHHPNQIRYATTTGRLRIHWAGARDTILWTVPAPRIDPLRARLELARRYLHVFGPTTGPSFARWAGIADASAEATFATLARSLVGVRTPIGDAWLLASDEQAARTAASGATGARLLPSGDTYFLLHGNDRELLITDRRQRERLWTTRVWPGAVLVNGEIVGTWRRAGAVVSIETWRGLSRAQRDAVDAESASLPLPDLHGRVSTRWARP